MKEVMDYSFKPQIKSQRAARDQEQFFKDQMTFKNTLEQNLNQIREEEDRDERERARNAHVTPSKGSQQIIMQKLMELCEQVTPPRVYDRLYHRIPLIQTTTKKSRDPSPAPDSTQKPRRFNKDELNRSAERLHSEEKLRRDKIGRMKEEIYHNRQTSFDSQTKDHNNKMVWLKLKQEFWDFLDQNPYQPSPGKQKHKEKRLYTSKAILEAELLLDLSQDQPLTSDKVTSSYGTPMRLKTFIKLMHSLGFIHVKNRSMLEEEQLTDIWKLLQHEGSVQTNLISAEWLLALLGAILNIQLPETLH